MQRVKWFKCDDGSFAKVGSVVLFALNTPECIKVMMKTMFSHMAQYKVIGYTGNQHVLDYCASLAPMHETEGGEPIMLFGHPYKVVDIATQHCSVRTWFVVDGEMSGRDIAKFLDEAAANTNPADDAHVWDEVIEVAS